MSCSTAHIYRTRSTNVVFEVTRIESPAHICVFEPPTLLTQSTLQTTIAAYTAKGERTWFNIPETETDVCALTE